MTQEPKWVESFREQFIRDDGLLDIGKYNADILISFIKKTIQSQHEEDIALRKKEQEELVWKINKDLNNGKFGMICSNETTFKNYITNLIKEQ